MATHTSPAAWWDEDEATVMTVVAILDEVAKAQDGKVRRATDDEDDDGRGRGRGRS